MILASAFFLRIITNLAACLSLANEMVPRCTYCIVVVSLCFTLDNCLKGLLMTFVARTKRLLSISATDGIENC